MSRVFILEDDETRISSFVEGGVGCELTICRDASEATRKYEPPYDLMFLDHDLGQRQMVESEDNNTGYAFVKSLPPLPMGERGPRVIIHSYNPVGALNMLLTLRDKGYSAIKIPFGKAVIDSMNAH